MKKNILGWFELPVADMGRAIAFYEKVLGIKLDRHQMGPLDMAWFPMHFGKEGAPGSLVYHKEFYKPSTDGALIYLSSPSGDLENELGLIEKAGGKILQQKTQISENYGYMALFIDSEGNRVALHSEK